MRQFAFRSEPDHLRHIRHSDWAGAQKVAGVAEQWNMPVALFEVRGGFENTADPGVIKHHTAKWRVAGAPVFARVGALRTQSDAPTGSAVCLQSRDSRASYWSRGNMVCAHVYVPQALVVDLATQLHEELGDRSDLLYADVPFSPDPLLAASAHRYFQRALDRDPPMALEMDTRSLAFTALWVTRYSTVSGIKALRLPDRLTPKQLMRAIDLLSSEASEELRLNRLAREVGLSSFHFCRAFRKTTGIPPHAWLSLFRMERAAQLLRHSSMRVAEVAAAVGYTDPSYFARIFKRRTGLAPLPYRARCHA